MQLYSSLPNELLHSIIEYIAYVPIVPGHSSFSKSWFRCASPELLVLSVVDRRLRRACLPFLFANIKVKTGWDAMNLKNHLALFSRFTKVLDIGIFPALPETGDQNISQILPQLKHLLYVELDDCRARTDLLRTIIAHPTVTSILVYDLPDESMCNDDLSKVISGCHTASDYAFSPHFQKYSNRGMRLASLKLESHLGSLNGSQFTSQNLFGLKEIQADMGDGLLQSSWLSVLSATHPNLSEFWLLNERHRSAHRTTPFLSSFLEESHRRDLRKFFFIEEVGLRRALGRSSQGWYVMKLILKTTESSTSLLEILTLAASSFPKLEVLTLNLGLHKAMYDIGDLASVLALFSSLRVLYLGDVFRRINFESRNTPSVLRVDSRDIRTVPKAQAEHKLSLLTSCLAKQVRTLDSFHIEEQGYEDGKLGYRRYRHWSLRGWLHVLNSNREVGGTLQ
ncbi:hypothetical protein FB446DRAFT_845216 [Lentinula raphanica]|nr:hypothetical protein FB446DRAFT_845216 [Lentinula raphanica]